MAEHFSFFDAIQESNGQYDREYNAQDFTKYFGALVTTGVMKGAYNMLAVSANGSNMVTKIDTGIAFVEAKYYENDSFLELTHDTETLGNSRIDRIVIRLDLSPEARYVRAFIKKGVPSTNPVAPTLTQTPNLYEISLAQVKIVGGQTFIATNAVTDERGKDAICPWAGSNILPNFDDSELQSLVEKVNTGLVDASTTQKGITKLNNTLTSTSIVEAATANVVKQVNDKVTANTTEIANLKSSVSNGKTQVANAITQKGVATSPTAEFATMAANIGRINTGKRFATGTAIQNGTYTFSMARSGAGNVITTKIEIYSIPFKPGTIYYSQFEGGHLNTGVWNSEYQGWNTNTAKLSLFNGEILNDADTLIVYQPAQTTGGSWYIILPTNGSTGSTWRYTIFEE